MAGKYIAAIGAIHSHMTYTVCDLDSSGERVLRTLNNPKKDHVVIKHYDRSGNHQEIKIPKSHLVKLCGALLEYHFQEKHPDEDLEIKVILEGK